jgi:CRISPR-associated protein Csm2
MSNRPNPGGDFPTPSQEDLRKIITDDGAAELLVQISDRLGAALAKPLATNQIRSIYSEVLRIKANWLESGREAKEKKERAKRAFILLRPKMQYRARKEGGAVKQLVDVLETAAKFVNNDEKHFRRFFDFFQAILAYHKAYGGK